MRYCQDSFPASTTSFFALFNILPIISSIPPHTTPTSQLSMFCYILNMFVTFFKTMLLVSEIKATSPNVTKSPRIVEAFQNNIVITSQMLKSNFALIPSPSYLLADWILSGTFGDMRRMRTRSRINGR